MELKSEYRVKCYACKEQITIERNKDYDDILFVDNHYFHQHCFEDMNYVKKTCYESKKDIIVHSVDELKKRQFVYYDGHYYIKRYFVKYCKAKNTKKRKFAFEHINDYIDLANEQLADLLEKKYQKYDSIEKCKENTKKQQIKYFAESDVNMYIIDKYKIPSLSIDSRIWRKLSCIYDGTFQKMDVPIPPEHLLDMWQRKENYLNKIYLKNVAMGKNMTEVQHILYDLSVLVGKYGSYIEWLQNNEINDVKEEELIKQQESFKQVDIYKLSNSTLQNNKKLDEDSDDMEDLLDEIFG